MKSMLNKSTKALIGVFFGIILLQSQARRGETSMVQCHGMFLRTAGFAYAPGAGVGLRLVAGIHDDYHNDDH